MAKNEKMIKTRKFYKSQINLVKMSNEMSNVSVKV